MPDNLSQADRSKCMSRISSRDTKPELLVRKCLHQFGFRYRLHRQDLPGCPDIVLPRLKKIVFVHGCFWHKHRCRYGRVVPKTNRAYWENKRQGNVQRGRKDIHLLKRLGWDVLVVWECWTRDASKLEELLKAFLEQDSSHG